MIHTLFKHYIYELCLSICFDELDKNLTDYSAVMPVVGDKFSKIIDNFSGDTFIDCTVINITDLGYWNDFNEDEYKNVAFAIRFRTWVDFDGIIQSDYDHSVYDEIHFDLRNFITLAFEK